MCGIAGIFHPDVPKPVDAARVRAMADALAHRGPDGSGVWTARGVGLGHRRLSIIDVGGSAQPMLDALVVDHGDEEVVRILVGLAKMRSHDFNGAATKFGELAGSTKLPGSLPFVKMALGLSLAQSSNTNDDRAADLLEDAVALEPRSRAVFAGTTEPVMIEGWNYAIFRDFYASVRERGKLKKFVRISSQAVQRRECT